MFYVVMFYVLARYSDVMPTKSISGISMHYQDRGRGMPVVLIHGFPLDSRMWEAQAEALSDRYRIIAPDLRGFGLTRGGGSFTMDSLAEDVHALLKEVGALPSVVAGLSMGGYVTLAYAKKYPKDLKGLMLIDTRAEADSPEAKENRGKALQRVKDGGAKAIADDMMPKLVHEGVLKHRQDIAHKLRLILESQSPETIAHALVALRDRPDRVSDLAAIPVPTLVIVGEHDAITPPALSEKMSKELTHPTVAIIKNAGHMAPMEQADDVNLVMRRFLEQIAR